MSSRRAAARVRAQEKRRRVRRALVRAGEDPVPRDEQEVLDSGHSFSLGAIKLMLCGMLPVITLLFGVSNLAFHNFSTYEFTDVEYSVLGLGNCFAPTAYYRNDATRCKGALFDHLRKLGLTDYFHEKPDQPTPEDWWDPKLDKKLKPPKFRVAKPDFNPLLNPPEGYTPPEGLLHYAEATAADLDLKMKGVSKGTPNLTSEQRAAINQLRDNPDIVIGDCDKNLGMFCVDTDHYRRLCLEELAKTHKEIIGETPENLIKRSLHAISSTVSKYMEDLPPWAREYLKEALRHIPKTKRPYQVAAFRALLKVHKSPPEVRGLSGNHVWCTQPLASLLANMLQPYVKATSTYVQDSDDFTRRLRRVQCCWIPRQHVSIRSMG